MTTSSKILDKLLERRQKIAAQIKAAQAKEHRKQKQIIAEKYRIIGTAIMAEMAHNKDIEKIINPLIDKHTTKPNERKILGLEPLPNSPSKNNDKSTKEKKK